MLDFLTDREGAGLHVVLVMSSQLAPDYLLINRNYGNIVLALTNPIQKSDQISSFISPPGGEKSNLNVKPRPQDKVSPPPLSQPSALDLAEVRADFREAIFPE